MEVCEEYSSFAPSISTVAVAIRGKKSCKSALKWALEKFSREGEKYMFKLIHVHPKITVVPTEMGNHIPISRVREDVASAYKRDREWQTNTMLLPYKKLCSQKKVEAEAVVVESDNIPEAISGEIKKFSISTLVLGASSQSLLARKFRRHDIPSRISECVPSFCSVYIVSKGRLSSVLASSSEKEERSDSNISMKSSSSSTLSPQTEWTDTGSGSNQSSSRSSSLLLDHHFQIFPSTSQDNVDESTIPVSGAQISEILYAGKDAASYRSSCSLINNTGSLASSSRTFQIDDEPCCSDQDITLDNSSSGKQVDATFELEKLRVELRHAQVMHIMAQNEANDASQHLHELRRLRLEEAIRLKEICLREEQVTEMAWEERVKADAMKQKAGLARVHAEREANQRVEAEAKAKRDFEEKKKLEQALTSSDEKYKIFTWDEIVYATSSFSDSLIIGMGGYGKVYKCSLNHTTAAVKVLKASEGQWTKQFEQELEVLSRVRHPHLLLLLGACPDHGCLVYEFMENGSLEDRLFRKNNTPPIPWFVRYRIAWEVASALAFLHNAKPKQIVHRDLKPANILLDHNFVSKIGDVGICTLLPADSFTSNIAKDTALAGTFCYIDPEYQRSGKVSPKSDVYALGMVILQLLTAKPALALAETVETALNEGRLSGILDATAGKWPIEETQELAAFGLGCLEFRSRDRPDLKDMVLPLLERLKDKASRAEAAIPSFASIPPNHFLCPILKVLMEDPCVAADGYTYEHRAIAAWLSSNDNSPVTNSPLPHKDVIPNFNLLSAIMNWKSQQ